MVRADYRPRVEGVGLGFRVLFMTTTIAMILMVLVLIVMMISIMMLVLLMITLASTVMPNWWLP